MKKLMVVVGIFFISSSVYADLVVSAAMSLKDVMTAIGQDFEKTYQKDKVIFNFAASGILRAQIEAGAPVDVFMPASTKDMDILIGKGLVKKESVVNVVSNEMVLVANSKSKLAFKTIEGLQDKNIVKIAIGNPETVPAGQYAKQTMTAYKVFDSVKNKLVYGENARQILDYVSRNEVDAGIVFATDALIDKIINVVFKIPMEKHEAIIYPIVVIKSSQKTDSAKQFLNFVISKKSQIYWRQYGFVVP